MSFYWTLSATYGLVQHMAFRFPAVRRVCRIPVVPSESATPVKDITAHFGERWDSFWQDVREKNRLNRGK